MENTFFNCLNLKIDYKITTWFKPSTKSSVDDCVYPVCSCCIKVKTTVHYLVHCLNYLMKEKPFWTASYLSFQIFVEQSGSFINVFLFGDTSLAR